MKKLKDVICKKHSGILTFLIPALLLLSCSLLHGQKLEPKKRTAEPDTTITSKIMGKDYQLYISFPESYSTSDTTKYPVLYVLDGLYSFPVFRSAREAMDYDRALEGVIIVGVGSGLDFVSWGTSRIYDYTPSQDTIHDRKLEKDASVQYNLDYNELKGSIQSGGAEKFLQCITTEIIPYVEEHYKTTSDRGISGFSLGGLFAAWCLLNSQGIFTRFGINSPSLWWNNKEILAQAEFKFSKKENWNIPFTKIFISVGEKEPPEMVFLMKKFSQLIESKKYKNVSLTTHVFAGETHISVGRPNLKRTIAVLYGKEK